MRQAFTGFERREQGNPRLAIALACAAWALLCWPWISGRVSIPWDSKAHFLPQLQFLAKSLGSGESSFWTPFVFSGHPQIADPQSLIFSPPFFLLAALNSAPAAWAADATLYLLLLASMAAMIVWLSDKGWHPAAALLSALSFGFGAAMAWRVQHLGQVVSLAYLPLVLMCLDRALMRRSIVWGMAAGVAAACHGARPRSGGAAGVLFPDRLCPVAAVGKRQPYPRVARRRPATGCGWRDRRAADRGAGRADSS